MQESKLCIGTAQFGQKYGVTNNEAPVDAEEAKKILRLAKNNHISSIDTAQNYGDSEQVIGYCSEISKDFKIITKLGKFDAIESNEKTIKEHLEKILEISMKRLRADKLEGLLLHEPSVLKKKGGDVVVDWLKKKKREGQIRKVGISIYEACDLRENDLEWIDIIQAPYSIYDQRVLDSSNGLKKKITEGNIELHVRSIYMQGVILQNSENIPNFLSRDFKTHHAKLNDYAKNENCQC